MPQYGLFTYVPDKNNELEVILISIKIVFSNSSSFHLSVSMIQYSLWTSKNETSSLFFSSLVCLDLINYISFVGLSGGRRQPVT